MTNHFPPNLRLELESGLKSLQIKFDSATLDQLVQFIKLLLKWNKAYNLTSISEPRAIIYRHILDSLSITPYLIGNKIIDVGTGAGFPGIPLAITLTNKKFILLDSNGKKTRFLTQVVAQLKLSNVEIVQERVEKYKPFVCFDHVITRAFATIEDTIAQVKHLICSDGSILFMKGVYPKTELEKIKDHVKVYPLIIPGLNEQRHLVCIEGSTL